MYSQATIDAILKLHNQGKPIAYICEQTKVSRDTVIKAIKRQARGYETNRAMEVSNRTQPYKWCPKCRARVQMPCVACRTRKAVKMRDDMAWLREYVKTPSDSTPADGP